MNDQALVRRVFLRFAFSRDPKVIHGEFDKLRDALKHLESAYTKDYDLSEGPNYHAYSQAIDSFRNIKFFVEHAGGSISSAKALVTLSKHPFIPADAVQENSQVFKDAMGEISALEQEFEKHQKAAA